MTSSHRGRHDERPPDGAPVATTWVVVASRDHARRGLADGFIMANHGQRAPLARMHVGDGILVYSPKTTHPDGEPLRAITIVGTVTGAEPEPSALITRGFCRRADLREIEPLTLDRLRAHLPTSRLRFGCFELTPPDATAIWALVDG
jgi:EVE domain